MRFLFSIIKTIISINTKDGFDTFKYLKTWLMFSCVMSERQVSTDWDIKKYYYFIIKNVFIQWDFKLSVLFTNLVCRKILYINFSRWSTFDSRIMLYIHWSVYIVTTLTNIRLLYCSLISFNKLEFKNIQKFALA